MGKAIYIYKMPEKTIDLIHARPIVKIMMNENNRVKEMKDKLILHLEKDDFVEFSFTEKDPRTICKTNTTILGFTMKYGNDMIFILERDIICDIKSEISVSRFGEGVYRKYDIEKLQNIKISKLL